MGAGRSFRHTRLLLLYLLIFSRVAFNKRKTDEKNLTSKISFIFITRHLTQCRAEPSNGKRLHFILI